jgi:hypothetical protein
LGTGSCELFGAEIVIDHGQKVKVFSVYCAPGWGLNYREVGDVLAVVWVISTLTASLGLGVVTQKDSSARAVQSLFDGLNLVHLNDGTLTRIASDIERH